MIDDPANPRHPTPWWVRNCIVLERFMPLGTQGGIGLPLAEVELHLQAGELAEAGRWLAEPLSIDRYLPPGGENRGADDTVQRWSKRAST